MKLVEIFKSIQGEGKNQGKPAVFIRLAGCNLNCSWCDTPHSHEEGQEFDNDEIVRRVEESGCKEICITGGEPLLQVSELRCTAFPPQEAWIFNRNRNQWHNRFRAGPG